MAPPHLRLPKIQELNKEIVSWNEALPEPGSKHRVPTFSSPKRLKAGLVALFPIRSTLTFCGSKYSIRESNLETFSPTLSAPIFAHPFLSASRKQIYI